jgi:hypothetical protein
MIPVGILTAAATSSFSFLLDDYPGAAAAYSLRKLRSAYTGNCIRVRRSSDNTAIDIGFLNNILDTTTLLTFVGAGNGVVDIWYDQSGNANNATSTASPDIVISGVLQTQNSKPCIRIRGALLGARYFDITNPIAANTDLSIFMTAKSDNTTSLGAVLGALGAPTVFFGSYGTGALNGALNAGLNGSYKFVTTVPDYSTANYVIYNCVVNSTNYYIYQNNNTFTISTSNTALNPTSFSFIGRYFNFNSNAIYSELIFYKSDQLANRTGIINNTNTFYTIF